MAKVSVIIPVKKINTNITDEVIPKLQKQQFEDFELIIVPDRKNKESSNFPDFVKVVPSWPETGPAQKRDLGAEKARGDILAFIDDDAYPEKNWLANAVRLLDEYGEVAAGVCGPGVTPPDDPVLAKVSGWMWSSLVGAGGAGTYRCYPGQRCEVDDFPTFNLIIRKKYFNEVGGFDSRFWPGEDTKLCHDLVYKLNKKIIYDPDVLVYHHRRKIFKPHLKQIGRYGRHRGFFTKVLPQTSKRIGYYLPLLFTLGVLIGPLFYFIYQPLFSLYLISMGIYFSVLLLTGFWVFIKSKNLLTALLVIPTIFVSHLFYGFMFLIGLLKKDFQSKYSREKI